jgi:hypothetical protein
VISDSCILICLIGISDFELLCLSDKLRSLLVLVKRSRAALIAPRRQSLRDRLIRQDP